MIRRLLVFLTDSTPGFEARFDALRSDPAFAPSSTRLVADLLSEISGKEPSTIAFGSEAAHLRALTDEAVVFGPGDMTVAHKSGEFVPEAELDNCVEYLKAAISSVCGASRTSTEARFSSEAR